MTMKNYTEAELEEINRRARIAANWGRKADRFRLARFNAWQCRVVSHFGVAVLAFWLGYKVALCCA